ncbi:MAG: undecaprenyl-phosphate glucose phosphotransferase [Bacteroidetes bacterium]|nr:undecaprenyl-phosphate glucose phosphotransferase [Bacteroidota bacterium]
MKRKVLIQQVGRYLIDFALIAICYQLSLFFTKINEYYKVDILFLGMSVLGWLWVSRYSNLYTDRRSKKFSEEIVLVGYHMVLFTVILGAGIFFLRLNQVIFSVRFIKLFLIFLGITTLLVKYFFRKRMHAALQEGQLFDDVLLVGSTPAALNFLNSIKQYYYYGYKCVGYVDNTHNNIEGYKNFGTIDNLEEVVKSQVLDEVVIALPASQQVEIQKCIDICDYYKIKVSILPDLRQYNTSSIYINNIGQMPVINVGNLPLDSFENKLIKRSFDIFICMVFFIFFGIWLMPLIIILIKLTSKGPAIFKQERWGLNNEKIICYKFRTMYRETSDTNEHGEYQQAYKGDPRITRIGKILRTTNFDELPQFWNVLIGNMSVVGPRPHPTPLNIESMHTVENYMLRHIVLPGITGYAQVNGCRGETKTAIDMQKRVDFDLFYIHRWNFWMDCQIIIQTVINFIRGNQDAY